ncbi:MAG: PqqD family protein [Anaerolineales bacterium]|nr:PqqD family protein [Anaerolineales bacterium]MCB8966084.1 PqqD family protein [Ardenticatenaceae bacterium]
MLQDLRPFPNPAVEVHCLLDEAVLYHPERDAVLALNRTARVIWEMCDGKRTLLEMSRELGQELGYTTDEEFAAILADIETTVKQLQELDVLMLVL